MHLKLAAFNDPGHGFVRVPADVILALKLENSISNCSYMSPKYVYLEEDSDWTKFRDAVHAAGWTVWIVKESYSDKPSHVRNYAPYNVEFLGGLKIGDVIHDDCVNRYKVIADRGSSYRIEYLPREVIPGKPVTYRLPKRAKLVGWTREKIAP